MLKKMDRNDRLVALADHIANTRKPFDMRRASCCFYGHALDLFNEHRGISHITHLASMLQLTEDEAHHLYLGYAGACTRASAVALLRAMANA